MENIEEGEEEEGRGGEEGEEDEGKVGWVKGKRRSRKKHLKP